MNKRVLVIIPAYNEAESIEHVIFQLESIKGLLFGVELDYIVVNDGSKDDTVHILNKNMIPYISLPYNMGIGCAVQTGYQYALENNYNIVVQFDGDGQHNANYIMDMIKPIMGGEADLVIGSRYIERKGFQSSNSRRMGIKILSDIIWLKTQKSITDCTSGFRAASKTAVKLFARQYPSDYPEPESIVTLLKNGMSVLEIPVQMNERKNGKSSINFAKSIYYMIKVSLAIMLH